MITSVKFTMLHIFVVYRKIGLENTSQTLPNNWRHCLCLSLALIFLDKKIHSSHWGKKKPKQNK